MGRLITHRRIWRGFVILVVLLFFLLFTCQWKALARAYLRHDPGLATKFQYIDAINDFSKPIVNIGDVGTIKSSDKCHSYMQEAVMERKVFYNVLEASLSHETVCLLSHFTMERLEMFERLLDRWDGPISVAFHVHNRDKTRDLNTINTMLTAKKRMNDILLHAVLQDGKYYPINYLRNVAQKGANVCDYFFQVDIDFVPSQNLHQSLTQHVIQGTFSNYHKYAALVVPAFEISSDKADNPDSLKGLIPDTKTDLLEAWGHKVITPMHQKKKTKEAHYATNFNKWKNAEATYKVKYRKGFEPYVLLPKKTTPPFISLFLQRYGNKVSYYVELDARGFEFVILPDVFIVHLPHPSLDSVKLFKEVGPCTSLIYRILISKAKKLKALS